MRLRSKFACSMLVDRRSCSNIGMPSLSTSRPVAGVLAAAVPVLTWFAAASAPPRSEGSAAATAKLIPEGHHGAWAGPNRLWGRDPKQPSRSDGAIECSADGIEYTWSQGDKSHRGKIRLHGQPAALRMSFEDTFHSPSEMNLHGSLADGVVRTYGTYAAGPEQPEWGWIIELDWRDPEAFTLRMFNVVPKVGAVPAVVLAGKRPS